MPCLQLERTKFSTIKFMVIFGVLLKGVNYVWALLPLLSCFYFEPGLGVLSYTSLCNQKPIRMRWDANYFWWIREVETDEATTSSLKTRRNASNCVSMDLFICEENNPSLFNSQLVKYLLLENKCILSWFA